MGRTTTFRLAIAELIRDSVHGGALKIIALLARILFFVLVVPLLATGELTLFIYVTSLAAMIAIVAILGLNEELPRVIQGNAGKARAYMPWFIALNATAMLALIPMYLQPSVTFGVVLFTIAAVAGRFLGGIMRSVDPVAYERVQNIPWALFLVCAVLLRLDTAFELLIARAATMCIVQWYGLYVIARRGGTKQARKRIALSIVARRGLSHGVTKLFSNLFLLGFMRATIIVPVWLGIESNLDPIAFAVAVGDVVLQFGLIPANRAYAKWCKSPPVHFAEWRNANVSGLLLAALLVFSALIVTMGVDALHLVPEHSWSFVILVQSFIFYSLVSAFRYVRYLMWSRGRLESWIAFLSCLMFILGTIAVAALEAQFWFASLAAITLASWAVMALTSRKFFSH